MLEDFSISDSRVITKIMKFVSILVLVTITVLVRSAPTEVENEEVGAANTVVSCSDVITLYGQVGYPVIDCFATTNATFWRLDVKLTNSLARAACRTAGNADLATVSDFGEQRILNDLYTAKVTLNTWMWIGIYPNETTGVLTWLDGTDVYPLRWYPFPDSQSNGNCAVQLILTDPTGDKDMAGTFYYTENCANEYIAACKANTFGL